MGLPAAELSWVDYQDYPCFKVVLETVGFQYDAARRSTVTSPSHTDEALINLNLATPTRYCHGNAVYCLYQPASY